MEPRYNKVPRDWENVFVVSGFCSMYFAITGLNNIVRYTGVFVIKELRIRISGFHGISGFHCMAIQMKPNGLYLNGGTSVFQPFIKIKSYCCFELG